jgi:hypothetical protein
MRVIRFGLIFVLVQPATVTVRDLSAISFILTHLIPKDDD